MKLEKNKHYKLKVNVHGRIIDYEGRILDVKSPNFYIRTGEDCKVELKLKNIIYFEKLPTPKKDIPTIVVRKKRVPKHLLKKQIEPKF